MCFFVYEGEQFLSFPSFVISSFWPDVESTVFFSCCIANASTFFIPHYYRKGFPHSWERIWCHCQAQYSQCDALDEIAEWGVVGGERNLHLHLIIIFLRMFFQESIFKVMLKCSSLWMASCIMLLIIAVTVIYKLEICWSSGCVNLS